LLNLLTAWRKNVRAQMPVPNPEYIKK